MQRTLGCGPSTVDRGLLNCFDHPEREQKNGADHFEHQSDGEPNDPEWEKDQPDEREQEECR